MVILRYQRDGSDVRSLTARLSDIGDLLIEGHDLGSGVQTVWGSGLRECEWERTIRAEHLPRLREAQGGQPGDEVLDVLATWCDEHGAIALTELLETEGIPVESWSWVSD